MASDKANFSPKQGIEAGITFRRFIEVYFIIIAAQFDGQRAKVGRGNESAPK